MNYLNHYNQLINTRKVLDRQKGTGTYFEKHHIVPRWLGGSDKKDNLILLTAKEHFIAHLLLWKAYRDRPSALAFHKMTKSNNPKQQRAFTAAQFEKARIAFVETQTGDKNWTRINGSPNKGITHVSKGKKLGPRDWMRGDNNPSRRPEVGEKISKALTGRIRSETHKANLGAAIKNVPKIKCEYCITLSSPGNHKRWHGDNCKGIK
jgi:hypothetical protein